MRALALFAIFFLLTSAQVRAQVRPPPKKPAVHINPDQLGLTCGEILQISSSDWVTKFNAAKGADAPTTIRAIGVYGKCYNSRTDQLAAKLGRAGKGPLMGARANFQSMDQALKTFTAKALNDSQPPADEVKLAYATLYEKQFRYDFYEGYEPKPALTPTPTSQTMGASAGSAATQPPSAGMAASDKAAAQDTVKPDRRAAEKASDADPVTQAKNHFGALLGQLPGQQMHEVHGAFAEILGPNAATSHMQLLVYKYAIFLLEPAASQPFSAPPF
jgi:hypothetical protein